MPLLQSRRLRLETFSQVTELIIKVAGIQGKLLKSDANTPIPKLQH